MPEEPALLDYLRHLDLAKYAKTQEIRGTVERYLTQIPTTFSNYTSHGIDHSDEIIAQLSLMLFDSESGECEIHLSSMEVYLLITACYLHDAGMVVSEGQRRTLLASEGWKEFTSEQAVAGIWQEIEEASRDATPDDLARYLRDIKTRFLVAEYFRKQHARRSAEIILSQESELGGFAFGDPAIKRTLADICQGHGYTHGQLDDPHQFPFSRTLMSRKVNVRLLAILLRIGDLLDVRYQRACPLIYNLNEPVPAHSMPHWQQYLRIQHFDVDPREISMEALCESHDEHRILSDWFGWLEDEAREAVPLLAGSTRHTTWRPPRVTLQGSNPTVVVRPAPGATYRPVLWKFELDIDAVLQRLIRDAYDNPIVFIRELLQNALDASRVALSDEIRRTTGQTPADMCEVPLAERSRYPITITISKEATPTPLNPNASRIILAIDDSGTGMTEDVIQRYLLQIGRSYYTAREFADRYSFFPSSRFGIGFLSVFAASNHIVIQTRSDESAAATSLTLTGPRNYLLFEDSGRVPRGTEVRVDLGSRFSVDELVSYINDIAVSLEFPIEIRLDGGAILREAHVGSEWDPGGPARYPINDNWDIEERWHQVDQPFTHGFLGHQFARRGDGAEAWNFNLVNRLSDTNLLTPISSLPPTRFAHNGLRLFRDSSDLLDRSRFTCEVIDLRGRNVGEMASLSRDATWSLRDEFRAVASHQWLPVVLEHLQGPSNPFAGRWDEWIYRLDVLEDYSLRYDDLLDVPDMVPIFLGGVATKVPLRRLVEADRILLANAPGWGHRLHTQSPMAYIRQFLLEGEASDAGTDPPIFPYTFSGANPDTIVLDSRMVGYFSEAMTYPIQGRTAERVTFENGCQWIEFGREAPVSGRIATAEVVGFGEGFLCLPPIDIGERRRIFANDHPLTRALQTISSGPDGDSVLGSGARRMLARMTSFSHPALSLEDLDSLTRAISVDYPELQGIQFLEHEDGFWYSIRGDDAEGGE